MNLVLSSLGLKQVLEKARQAKMIGSSLEAKVYLYVEDDSLREALKVWNQQPNTADPLRFMFIVSQACSLISPPKYFKPNSHYGQTHAFRILKHIFAPS